MNGRLAGEVVYCDSPGYDGMWLNASFDYGETVCAFGLGDAIKLFQESAPERDVLARYSAEA